MKSEIYALFLVAIFSYPISSQQIEKCYNSNSLSKRSTANYTSAYSLNDFYSVQNNSGEFDNNKNDNGNTGFYFPTGSKKGVAFSSGLIWIGKQNNVLKASGNIYSRSTLTPGKILQDGKPEDPLSEKLRVYRVRTNYKTSLFENEIANGEGTYHQIYSSYEKDWNEWPAGDGAPFNDVNKNGIYEPSVDIPGVPGAHQTLWFVSNDLTKTTSTYFGFPNDFGIEIQVTVWGYETESPVKNTIFRKYKLINKSNADIKEVFTGIFSDATANASSRTYAGSDSTLGLGFAYNPYESDYLFGKNPPALGFKYLQGPLVEGNANNFGLKNGKKIFGKKNLQATSFVFYTCGGIEIPWPSNNAAAWYSNLQGVDNRTGKLFEIPSSFGGGSAKFVCSGDPVKKIGWVDGISQSCGQRYLLLGSGPFNLAASDTQEIVFAEIVGVGSDNLTGITSLKDHAIQSQKIYDSTVLLPSAVIPFLTKINPSSVELSTDQNSVTINWNKDQSEINRIEKFSDHNYKFQGYNVYQVSSDLPVKDAGKLIATFDIADGIKTIKEIYCKADGTTEERAEQFGNDIGLSYSFKFSKDNLANIDFVKGKPYSFAVSAYYVSPEVSTQTIINRKSYETPLTVLTTEFRKNEPGINYKDQILVQSKLNYTKDNCKIYVANPAQLTDHNYQINFKSSNGSFVWNLLDKTLDKDVLTNQSLVQENYYYYLDSWMPKADGFQFLLLQPNKGVRDNGLGIVEVSYGGKDLTTDEFDEKGKDFLGNHVWNDPNYTGINNERDKYYLKVPGGGILLTSYDDFSDYEIRFTSEGSYALTSDKVIIQIPIEIWKIGVNTPNDTKDDIKLIPISPDIYSSGPNYWASKLDTEINLMTSLRMRGLKVINKSSATAEYDAFKNACVQSGGVGKQFNMAYDNGVVKQNVNDLSSFIFVDADKNGNPPPAGTVVRIITKKELSVNDVFEFNKNSFTDLKDESIPDKFSLSNNYPNPFNPETTISYSIPQSSHVTLKVYDVLGREIVTLVDEVKQAGTYNSKFSIRNSQVTSGVYFYRIQANSYSETKKMVLIK